MDEIGVGVIGTGFMGKCHALALGAVKGRMGDVPRPLLKILCDVDEPTVRVRADEWGFARATNDWRTLIADPEVQLVSVTTPNRLHREMAIAALEAGKHVWCEKPMGLTFADAVAMTEAARKAPHLKTQVGFNYTRNPAISHARRLIAAGVIGHVHHFTGVMDEDYMADAEIPWSWRCRKAEAGTGVLGDMLVHLISIAHLLAGRIVRVTGEMQTVHASRPMPGGGTGVVDNDDSVQALVRFEGGATGVIGSSRVVWGRKAKLAWEVHGTKGTITANNEHMNDLNLFVAEGDPATRGFRTILTGPAHPPYAEFCPAPGHGLGFNDLKVIECAEFLRAIAGGPPVDYDFEAALAIERVTDAIDRSAAEQHSIVVSYTV
jgi:predicted dehydrogenase